MKTETIVMCIVSLILGMIMFHMVKLTCGCKTVEGQPGQSQWTSKKVGDEWPPSSDTGNFMCRPEAVDIMNNVNIYGVEDEQDLCTICEKTEFAQTRCCKNCCVKPPQTPPQTGH